MTEREETNSVLVLKWLGAAELVTLVLMLVNIVTVHSSGISSALGPAHGVAYTGTVIAGILAAESRRRVAGLSLIPGVGGWLAYRTARAAAAAEKAAWETPMRRHEPDQASARRRSTGV